MMIPKYKIQVLLLLSISIFATSCTSIYMPNVPNTPMLSKKGEFHAEAHLSLKSNVSINTAYALQNHFAVMMNASTMTNTHKNKDLKHQLFEAGVGYFTPFGKDNNKIFELYMGLGKGGSHRTYRTENNGVTSTEVQDFGLQKVFIQANYSNKKAGNLRLFGKSYPLNYGTALRFSYLTMSKFLINQVPQNFEDNMFFEPLFFTRLRLNNVLQLQYTSGTTIGFNKRKYLKAGNSVMTIGVILNVGGQD